MGFWKRLFRGRGEEDFDYEDEEGWEEEQAESAGPDMSVPAIREDLVRSCLKKVSDAAKELENLNFEYNMVTSYLKDMEEIEALPDEETEELQIYAKKVELLQSNRDNYVMRGHRMGDERFYQMEQMIDESEEECRKIREAEEYQELVKKDLNRLDGEKHAYTYRRHELSGTLADIKGIALIAVIALGICIVLLLALQFAFDMDTRAGYLITAAVAAVVLVFLYVRHMDARHELSRVENGINRIIQLQNTVKIRYVNNKKLLDYLCKKCKVSGSEELEALRRAYFEEKEEREKFRRAEMDLDYNEQQLLKVLKRYQISDPAIWLHQTEALLDHKEMVEIRHNLILRRQSLRRRMDYDREVIEKGADREIQELTERYPDYKSEIIAMVEKCRQNV